MEVENDKLIVENDEIIDFCNIQKEILNRKMSNWKVSKNPNWFTKYKLKLTIENHKFLEKVQMVGKIFNEVSEVIYWNQNSN